MPPSAVPTSPSFASRDAVRHERDEHRDEQDGDGPSERHGPPTHLGVHEQGDDERHEHDHQHEPVGLELERQRDRDRVPPCGHEHDHRGERDDRRAPREDGPAQEHQQGEDPEGGPGHERRKQHHRGDGRDREHHGGDDHAPPARASGPGMRPVARPRRTSRRRPERRRPPARRRQRSWRRSVRPGSGADEHVVVGVVGRRADGRHPPARSPRSPPVLRCGRVDATWRASPDPTGSRRG